MKILKSDILTYLQKATIFRFPGPTKWDLLPDNVPYRYIKFLKLISMSNVVCFFRIQKSGSMKR